VLIVLGLILLGLSELLFGAFATLALLNHPEIASGVLRKMLAGLFALTLLAALLALFLPEWRWPVSAIHWGAIALFLATWSRVEPSNNRDWLTEVSRTPRVTVTDDAVRFHDVRDFDYRSAKDFDARWYDRAYRLDRLRGVDLFSVHWMGPAIAHMFVSFDFGADGRVAISIEARKSKGEGYSSVLGFFRHYELAFIVADERDVVRLRTNHRKAPTEDVYLYRLSATPEEARGFLMSYVRRINSLAERPEFYNTLTTNCTNTIWQLANVNPGHVPFSWKVLVSGYAAEYLYDQGRLDRSMPFDELTARGHVNARGLAAGADPAYSELIRKA
jgi:Domain of unknown function (DUF4105)